jgi:hypothetical protein
VDDPLVGFVAVVSQRAAIGQAARAAALGEPILAGGASTHVPATHLLVRSAVVMVTLAVSCAPFAAWVGAIIAGALARSGWLTVVLLIPTVIVTVLVVRTRARLERWSGWPERRWPTTVNEAIPVVLFEQGFVCRTAGGMAAVRWDQVTRFQIHELPREWSRSGARSVRVLMDVKTAGRWRVQMRYESGRGFGAGLAAMFIGRVPHTAFRGVKTHKTRVIWDG